MIDVVSETTHMGWNLLYEMGIGEFLTYVCYIKYKRKKEQKAIDAFKNKKTY